jgi:hypothetical protein
MRRPERAAQACFRVSSRTAAANIARLLDCGVAHQQNPPLFDFA